MPDASIIFKTTIDNSDVQRGLDEANKKIDKAAKDIDKQTAVKLPLVDQADDIKKKYKEAVKELEILEREQESVTKALAPGSDPESFIRALEERPGIDKAVQDQTAAVKAIEKEYDVVAKKIDNCNEKIENSRKIMKEQAVIVGELSAKLVQGGEDMSAAVQKASEGVLEVTQGINDCGDNVSAVTEKAADKAVEVSAEISKAGEDMSVASEKAAKKTSEFGKRLVSLAKSALIFSVITAGLTAVRNYMGKALKTNKEFTAQMAKMKAAMLTAFQPIYDVVVPALIILMRILTAVFQGIARLFSFFGGKSTKQNAKAAKSLYEEADAIDAVGGAAKAAKKELAGFDEITTIGSADAGGGGGGASSVTAPDFTDLLADEKDLDRILWLVTSIGTGLLAWSLAKNFAPDLKTAAGIALAVAGAFMYAFSWSDAFTNGIDWGNLTVMLMGVTAAVAGLALVFGTTGAAVGMLIGGIGLIVVGLKDFITTGEMTNEALVALEAGILLVGGAISLMTGNWIPLLLAAVAGLVLMIATKGEDLKRMLSDLDRWLQNIFARDWTEVFGPVLGGALNGLLDVAEGMWKGLKQILEGVIDFIGGAFSGDWTKAWNGILSIINGVLTAIVGGVNAVIRLLNKLSFTIPDWVPSFGGKKFGFNLKTLTVPQIPYLAQGAVIPPNAPFMAVLGDQRHGANIEAPLSTIQEAVAMVMEDYAAGNLAGQEAILAVLKDILEAVLGIEVGDEVIGRAVSRYNSRLATMRGDA